MKHITDPSELEVGREYWLVDKATNVPEINICKERDGRSYFASHFWVYPSNNQAMERWDVFGPIPVRIAPDFKALMAEKLSNPKVHDCLFTQRANVVS